MSVLSGPDFGNTNGLIVSLDPGSERSYSGTNLINPRLWTTGSGSFTGFTMYGTTAENERVNADDPHGNTSVVWESRPDTGGGTSGGFVTSTFPIDRTKMYRFSVWTRRNSATASGTLYLGTNGFTSGSNTGVIRNDTGATETNPYWDCPAMNTFTNGQWVLIVGHVFPYTYTGTTGHPDSGAYTISGGKIRNIQGCNTGTQDVRWTSTTTDAQHRAFNFGATSTAAISQFFNPMVEVCDGTELSIGELLHRSPRMLRDRSPLKTNNAFFVGIPEFTSNNSGGLTFNGTNNSLTIPYNSTMDFSLAQTIIMWLQPATGATNARRNPYNQAYGGSGTITHETNGTFNYYFGTNGSDGNPYVGKGSGFTVVENELAFICVTRSQTLNLCRWYKNGVLSVSSDAGGYAVTNNGSSPIQIANGYTSRFIGVIHSVQVFNRFFTDDEVLRAYETSKNRYMTVTSVEPGPTPTPTFTFTPTNTPTNTPTSTSTPTFTPTTNCTFYDIFIDQADLDEATGNLSFPERNGQVFVTYTNCSGFTTTDEFGDSGLYTNIICVQLISNVSLTYWKNDQENEVSFSFFSDTLNPCGSGSGDEPIV